MKNIALTVNKRLVYNEVAKTTAYTGAKQLTDDDKDAYERIFTKDDDRLMLERFWTEATDDATDLFKPFIVSVSNHPENGGLQLDNNYDVHLELSDSFDETLKSSMESGLFSFFVAVIVSKWFKFTNKDDADAYLKDAAAILKGVALKLYHRKKPVRVVPVRNS